MTREEAKKLLPIIQAFAEGRTIQLFGRDGWTDLYKDFIFDISYRYRIKPEPRYRPFKNVDECWQEMLKHQPFGIVSSKHDKAYMAFESLDDGICNFNGYREESFESAFDDIQFADGAPFGIKTEQ